MSVLASWPDEYLCISDELRHKAVSDVQEAFSSAIDNLRLDIGFQEMVEQLYVPMAAWIAEQYQRNGGPLVLGVNGAQGAGKSTLTNLLEVTLSQALGLRVVAFSLDDLYKTRQERLDMSNTIHPLFMTRGVPGTHDVQVGLDIIEALKTAQENSIIHIPVFDKSIDDRCPDSVWKEWVGPADIIILEGWCVGATAQSEAELERPVNDLERQEDSQGIWRRYVNQQLNSDYKTLFSKVDLLLMLQVPSMKAVFEWRSLQEKKLAERVKQLEECNQSAEHLRIMNPIEIQRFIQHYERLTCAMLKQLPHRADLVLQLNHNHKIDRIKVNQQH